jgi:hypothetical protein
LHTPLTQLFPPSEKQFRQAPPFVPHWFAEMLVWHCPWLQQPVLHDIEQVCEPPPVAAPPPPMAEPPPVAEPPPIAVPPPRLLPPPVAEPPPVPPMSTQTPFTHTCISLQGCVPSHA